MSELFYGILRGMKEVAEATENDRALTFIDKLLSGELTEDVDSSETDVNSGIVALLNNLIISEYDAIDQYNSAIVTAQSEGVDDIVPLLQDIVTEEHIHVGQLQAAVKLFDKSADAVEEGTQEGKEQLQDIEK